MEPSAPGFIDLSPANVAFLIVTGLLGGLVSGFIGSGGAFVYTPGMMSMGVPGIVAVASNLCHQFPRALVGAVKRSKYGHVDLKLGLIMGASAEAGVLVGTHVQGMIRKTYGAAGSNLYVSLAFVVVSGIVGCIVLLDALKLRPSGDGRSEGRPGKLARWVQSLDIPDTMVHLKGANVRVSALFTIPLGFAAGLLGATIALGGFIGVPGMIYVLGVPSLIASGTELVIAFIIGLSGTINYAWHGLVDIRLAMSILAGSLFGVQLGAISTTYVRPYMIKVVMGTVMLIAALSPALMIPVYLAELSLIRPLGPAATTWLKRLSLSVLIIALAVGAFIILRAFWHGRRAHLVQHRPLEEAGITD